MSFLPSFRTRSLTDDKGPRGEEKVLPLRPLPPPPDADDAAAAAHVLVDGEQRRLRPATKASLNLPPKSEARVAHPRRWPSLPLPVDEEPLPTVPAVAVVATVAGLYVVPPLDVQTAPLRCKRRRLIKDPRV